MPAKKIRMVVPVYSASVVLVVILFAVRFFTVGKYIGSEKAPE